MKKRFIIVSVILAIIFGGTFVWHLLQGVMIKHFLANQKEPPVTISTTIAKETRWHPMLNAIGTLRAVHGVEVNSELPGQVVEINFRSGSFVKKGDLLVRLDDAIDQQTLNNNLATLHLDKLNYQRQSMLYKRGATAKSDFDAAQAKMLQAEAQTASARVTIEEKKIKAPFDGKLGIRQVELGQYLIPGQSIVLLQMLDPIYLDFDLPEQELSKLKVGEKVQVTTDAQPGKVFRGEITAIDSAVSAKTRTISVRATLPNKGLALYPGLFADVKVILPEQSNVLVVPQTAVTYSLFGDSVYVVVRGKDKSGKPTLTAQQRFVSVGERRGTMLVIKKGIKPGEEVVNSGQLKLHPGSPVLINNSISLENTLR